MKKNLSAAELGRKCIRGIILAYILLCVGAAIILCLERISFWDKYPRYMIHVVYGLLILAGVLGLAYLCILWGRLISQKQIEQNQQQQPDGREISDSEQ